MALKPTIYKFDITLSDVDRSCYETLALTVAQHPSETTERMMVRVLARCLHHHDNLAFTRGLSENDEPDLWQHSLDGRIELWIEAGEPNQDRLKKARGQADRVVVYTFNNRSDVWWTALAGKLKPGTAEVYRFNWSQVCGLADLIDRTVELSVTINRPSMFVAGPTGEIELELQSLVE